MVVASSLFAAAIAATAATLTSAHPHQGSHHHHHLHRRANIVSQCKHDFSFTWDDGPYTWTSQTIDAFNARGAKATFFMNGNNWGCIYDSANVAAVKKAWDGGHQLASHTWSHYRLEDAYVNGVLNTAKIDEEVQRFDEAMIRILGVRPRYLRPPYGSINTAIADYIEQTHHKVVVLWDEDSGDTWNPPRNAQQLLEFYEGLGDAAVASGQCPLPPHFTLAHDVQKPSIDSAPDSIDALQEAGYNLVTTAECMDDAPYEYVGAPGTPDASWTCEGPWVPMTNPPPTSSSSTSSSVSSTSSTSSASTSSTATPTCLRTYTSKAGDTCASIGTTHGMTAAEVQAANTFLNCNDIWEWTSICITTASNPSNPTTPTCLRTYTSKAGDTCASIGTTHGMTAAEVQAANSFLNCNDIWEWTSICITTASNPSVPGSSSSSSVPPTSTPQPQCAVTYYSRPGENCAAIEDKMGMSSGALKAANSHVNCNDIWAWSPLCIPANSSDCSRWERANSKTTCSAFGDQYGVNGEVIGYWNPNLNCNDVWQGTWICVAH